MPMLSLWLEPEAVAAATSAATINQVAAHLGTQTFAPHVTIIGGFEADVDTARQRLTALASDFSALEITFEGYGFDDFIVRAAYLEAIPTPVLMRIHRRAEELYGFLCQGYTPHMSLLYTDSVPEDIRRRAIADLIWRCLWLFDSTPLRCGTLSLILHVLTLSRGQKSLKFPYLHRNNECLFIVCTAESVEFNVYCDERD